MNQLLNQSKAQKQAIEHLTALKSRFINPHLFRQTMEGVTTLDVREEKILFKTLKEAKAYYKIQEDENCIVIQECLNPGDREYYDSLKE